MKIGPIRVIRESPPPQKRDGDSTLENPSVDLVQAIVGLTDGTTVSSVSLTPAKALRLTAVYAAVSAIAETCGSLPLPIREAAGTELQLGRGRKLRRGDPRDLLLNVSPNPEQTPAELFETWFANACLWGKGHLYVDWNDSGQPAGLWPLRPDRTEELRTKSGQLYYATTLDSGETRKLMPEQVIPLHSIYKLSPIRTAREAVAGAIAAEEYSSRFWANNARPGGLIKTNANWDDTEFEEFRRRWRAGHEGLKRSHLVGILSGGAEWQDVGVPPQIAQMIESRNFGVRECARLFGVPPHRIGDLQGTVTHASIEQQSIEFVTYTLRKWLVRGEQALRKKLFMFDDDLRASVYPQFHTDALLRGDLKSLYDAYAVGVQWGWLCRADVRELLDMEVPDDQSLDDFLVPLNMTTSGMIKQLQTAQMTPETASAIGTLALMLRSGQAGEQALAAMPQILRFLEGSRERELEYVAAGNGNGAHA